MDNIKREELIALYDLYYNLLTDKQREYFEDYYFMDLSISEIAQNYEISRNGAYDQIKRTEKLLFDYESKLQLYNKINRISNLDIDADAKDEVINIIKE